MLLNNTEKDIKMLLLDEGMTQKAVADTQGKTLAQINAAIKHKAPLNKSFVEILDTLGYDIQIEYVKRG